LTGRGRCRTDARVSQNATRASRDAGDGRVVFVDVLRLVATFQMVQGHTLDAVLAVGMRSGAVFEAWQSVRGLTAVAFLFAAGLAFQITTLSRLSDYRSRPSLSSRRVLRAFRLIGFGYLLHLPVALLWVHDAAGRASIVADFFNVDVLQCIGVSLIVLELLVRVLPTARQVAMAASVLGAAAFVLAPFMPHSDSVFPIIPWAGHVWLGVGIAQLASQRWFIRLLMVGAGLLVVSFALRSVSEMELIAMHVGRLASVTLISALLVWSLRGQHRLPGWLERLAGETLTVYVFHILLVYGAGVGLATMIGPTLALPMALVVTLVVMAASVGAVRVVSRGRILRAR